MLFPFFYIASWGYRLGFALHRLSHTIFGTRRIFPARIISVGNLSVGGTGKSVFVRYLLSFLDQQKCGVVMRGYARKNKQKKEPIFVDNKSNVLSCGDEAKALASRTSVPVVVCSNKGKAIDFLLKKNPHIQTIILDDGYQSQAISRDLDIVLLDARYPLQISTFFPQAL